MSRVLSLAASLLIASGANAAEKITFHRDVLPILQNRCQECHRDGEIGPFALMDYKDEAKKARNLVASVGSRQMPPWKPVDGIPMQHDRRMTKLEIETLTSWIADGTLEGDPIDAPKPRAFPKGWALGEPDLILEMPADMHLAATGDDHFRCMVDPIELTGGHHAPGLRLVR